VARYTRHQLKEDKFTETAAESLSWMHAHRGKITAALLIVLLAGLGAAGAWFYMQRREQQASLELSKALRSFNAPLRDANTPPNPDMPSFTSAKERAEQARKEFKKIAEKYKYSRSGEAAGYLEALAAITAGDTAGAEQRLKEVAGSRNKDLASLARMKLASLYRSSNRDDQAVSIYRELVERPTRMVTKEMAQLELASLYESKDPKEAQRIYQSLQAENPSSAAAEVARTRLQGPR
jgi:predicted negative regulator of RcsB-dependent stress response